ncbi:alpha/beta hydrolase [Cytophagales bacterium LB-30]|uniref:Alpha/beta hydrolase n=1 Tax=Shiella aurantiaca TaxID=3058365 RepID=A0ABT8F8J0_9BACT|nr:alpha/beta hydrolase [Shiella aurantiaca]MDN4166703.1 alpha/beta hydrolase [Shiella aurantiaca]
MAFLFLALLGITACSKDNSNSSPYNEYTKNTLQYKSVNGVDSNLLSLDIYHYGQTGAQKPVVIYVHGGGFAFGDKANNITNKLNLFSSLEYIFISINYRLSPQIYSTDPNRIMYPTHHNDVADAVKWVYDNIENYGGNNQKIALLGHSAGAQLVALTGTSSQFLPTRGINLNLIKGIACIDTEGYDVVARGNENNQVYLNAFGQTNTFWFEASPINNLFSGTNYPKFFIAKRGSKQRIGYSDAFITKLQQVGSVVREVTANQYDHEGINDAIGASGETIITEPLARFFAECFHN